MRGIFLIWLAFVNFVSVNAAEFDLQYIGDSLDNETAQAREFCTTKYCVGDSQILFYAATQNASVDPCKDFKEFSMGTVIRYRALHERYFSIGLLPETQRLHEERLRKLLASKKSDGNDVRVFKVMRNFFAKCVSSKNVVKNGKKEIIDYLQSLGGSPFLSGDAWDPSKFNVSKVLQLEPYLGVLTLLDYEFKPWSNLEGWNKTHAIPSFIKEGLFSWEDPERLTYKHYKQMLVEMFDLQSQNSAFREAFEEKIDKAVARLEEFEKVVMKHKGVSEKRVLKVKELNDYTPNLNVDWLSIVNDQLLNSVKLSEEDDILLYSPDTLKSLAADLSTIDKGIVAEAFALKLLYANRFLFIVYPFDWKDEEYTSNTRALQRWEQCFRYVKDNMRPALEVLLSTAKERNIEKLDKFAKDAIDDFIRTVKALNESILSKEVNEKVIEKLNKITVLSKLFARNFSQEKLEDYYDELNLRGDEDLVQSALEIKKFRNRIRNDYKDIFTEGSKSWLDSASQKDLISYNTLSDELNIPAVWTFYPWYHADRPKFFNQATLYLDIITAVKSNIVRYTGNVLFYDAQNFYKAIEEFKFAYDHYVEWELNGGKDLLLGANRLTTHQLFWLALARSRYRKQKGVPGIEGNDYDRTFFWFKHKEEPLETYESFKEAYHCSEKDRLRKGKSEPMIEPIKGENLEASPNSKGISEYIGAYLSQ